MKSITFLGTGTSTGVPQIGCKCPTCTSCDPCDKRMRTSALVEIEDTHILIDCGPDFRTQMLLAGSPSLDACLLTHIHYDHVGGIDDLRPYCAKGPFPIFCQPSVAKDLMLRLPYCFKENPYPGVPALDIKLIHSDSDFSFNGITITPLHVMHGQMPILGFKIGDMAYITDCKTMPDETKCKLKGIDTLVINALRHTSHPTHLSLKETLEIVNEIGPRRTYLIHVSHQMHPQSTVELPAGVQFAHDMMKIYF